MPLGGIAVGGRERGGGRGRGRDKGGCYGGGGGGRWYDDLGVSRVLDVLRSYGGLPLVLRAELARAGEDRKKGTWVHDGWGGWGGSQYLWYF